MSINPTTATIYVDANFPHVLLDALWADTILELQPSDMSQRHAPHLPRVEVASPVL